MSRRDITCQKKAMATTGRSVGAPRVVLNADNNSTCETDACNTSDIPSSSGADPPQDDDLRRVSEAWPTLPEPVKTGFVAMVKSVEGEG